MKIMGKRQKPLFRPSLHRRVWVSIALFAFAAASLAFGAYNLFRPAWASRADIREYNTGVISYYMLPGAASQLEPQGSAVVHFAQARSMTADPTLQSLSAYNAGTILSNDVLQALVDDQSGQVDPGLQPSPGDRVVPRRPASPADQNAVSIASPIGLENMISQALASLTDAVRSDPSNEDAKYNLELLEKMLNSSGMSQEPGNGPGYNPGNQSGQSRGF